MLPRPNSRLERRGATPPLPNRRSLVPFDPTSDGGPTKYAYREITVVATVDEVRLVLEDRLVARHPRHWGREQYLFNPVHYLALLEKKPGGLDYARPLEDWNLPKCFDIMRRRLEREDSDGLGTREFIRVLRLLERATVEQPAGAVE